jgi:hypothetical protein
LNEWVGGVVLDPQLPQTEALGELVGADERCQPRLERIAGTLRERQEIRIAPDAWRAGLDLAASFAGLQAGEIVGGLERPKAVLAHIPSLQGIARSALLARQRLQRHRL